MDLLKERIAPALVGCIVISAASAALADDTMTPPKHELAEAKQFQICTAANGRFVVDPHKAASWLVAVYGLNITRTDPEILLAGNQRLIQDNTLPDDLTKYIGNMEFPGIIDQAGVDKARKEQTDLFRQALDAVDSAAHTDPDSNSLYVASSEGQTKNQFKRSKVNFNNRAWFSQSRPDSPYVIVCKPPASSTATAEAPPASASTPIPAPDLIARLRVRGTPDSLAIDRNSPAFGSADKATISFSDNGVKKTGTDALQTTVGYAVVSDPNISIVPFVWANRNLTYTANKPTVFSKENVELGIMNSYTFVGAGHEDVFALTPGYLMNYIDNSRIYTTHASYMPIINGFLNSYYNIWSPNGDPIVRIAPVVDLRGDVGLYSDRGTSPSTNQDYGRAGTKFGLNADIDVFAPVIPSSTVSVTHTYLYGVAGVPRDINYFQASWTINFIKDTVGLVFSYNNGDLETTGQRDQSWLASLAVKY